MSLRAFILVVVSIFVGAGGFAWLDTYTSMLTGSETDFSVLSFRSLTLYDATHPSGGQIFTQSGKYYVIDLQLDHQAQLHRDQGFSKLTGWDIVQNAKDKSWNAISAEKPVELASKNPIRLPLRGIYPMTSLSRHTAGCSQLSMSVSKGTLGKHRSIHSILTLLPGVERNNSCTLNVGLVFSKLGSNDDGSSISAYLPEGNAFRMQYLEEDLVWQNLTAKKLVGRLAHAGRLELPKNGSCRCLPDSVLEISGQIELTRLIFSAERLKPHIQAVLYARWLEDATVDSKNCSRPSLGRFISSWSIVFASIIGIFLAVYEAVKIKRSPEPTKNASD